MAVIPALSVSAQDARVEVKTTLGDFTLLLYGDTPLHKENFLKLVNSGAYDGMSFHRVIKNFMVQTGDPNSKENVENPGPLGTGSIGERIPAEINYPRHYNKYGALAAARDNNPRKMSSGSQFYIVTGNKFPEENVAPRIVQTMQRAYVNNLIEKNMQELKALQAAEGRAAVDARISEYIKEAEQNITKAPEAMVETYVNQGGAPHLDGDYTVFGEVISGMDTVEKIQNVETGEMDVPVEPVRIISMKVVK